MAEAPGGKEVARDPETEQPTPEAMLEMIIAKEDEIKKRFGRAEDEAQRLIEEAKLDASVLKREATSAEVGTEIREKELEKAREEAGRIAAGIEAQAEEIRKKGMERVDEAVRIVIEGVMPPME